MHSILIDLRVYLPKLLSWYEDMSTKDPNIGTNVYKHLAEYRLKDFLLRYNHASEIFSTKKKHNGLIHAGEYGMYKECLVEDLLKHTIPQRYSICSGFLINHKGIKSTQCDLIIYDSNHAPFLEEQNNLKFVPQEIVYGVIEVKSKLRKQDLFNALIKLSESKKIRPSMQVVGNNATLTKLDPINNHRHAIMTMLICDSVKGWNDDICRELDSVYENKGILPCFRHNIVCSLENGLITYDINEYAKIIHSLFTVSDFSEENYKWFASPFFSSGAGNVQPLKSVVISQKDNLITLKNFLCLLNNCIMQMESFYPEPKLYLYE